MKSHVRSSAGGQVLPLFAILVPGMLVLMALGVDAANVFLERRDAQGAADLAAVSGAKLLAGAGTPAEKAAAEQRAQEIGQANGYTAAEITAEAHFTSDPTIEVEIDTQIPTYFMPILNFFGLGDFSKWDVSARAVAEAKPGSSSEGTFALYALEPCGEEKDYDALNWSGNENSVIGAAHSNAAAYISGNGQEIDPGGLSVTCGSSGVPAITDKYPYNEGGDNPDLPDGGGDGGYVPGLCTGPPGDSEVCRQVLTPPTIPFATYDPATGLYSQTELDAQTMSSACDTTWSGSSRDVFPADIGSPGVYCLLDGLMVIKGGTYPHNVSFFAEEFSIGDANTVLSAHLDGILMYATTTIEDKGIDVSGDGHDWTGILYSPFPKSKIQYQGNSSYLTGALVGYRVDYSGNGSTIEGDFATATSGLGSIALIE